MCSATRGLEREVVLAAVQRDGYALVYASAELRADRKVVLAALRRSPHGYALIGYASPELRAELKAQFQVNRS